MPGAQAFVCDVTRVASYMMLSVASEVQFGEIGHSTTQHGDSHAGDNNYSDGRNTPLKIEVVENPPAKAYDFKLPARTR